MEIPSAIIFVNNDLTPQVQHVLTQQLYITQVMDGYTFDGYVIQNPNYVQQIHYNNQRILVIRTFWDLTNRNLADVAIFLKNGLAYILKNNLGAAGVGQAYQIAYLTMWSLLPVLPEETGVGIYHATSSNVIAPGNNPT